MGPTPGFSRHSALVRHLPALPTGGEIAENRQPFPKILRFGETILETVARAAAPTRCTSWHTLSAI